MMGQARCDAGAPIPSGLESSSGTLPSACAPPAWPAFLPFVHCWSWCRGRPCAPSVAPGDSDSGLLRHPGCAALRTPRHQDQQ